jgi:hypothetical protein
MAGRPLRRLRNPVNDPTLVSTAALVYLTRLTSAAPDDGFVKIASLTRFLRSTLQADLKDKAAAANWAHSSALNQSRDVISATAAGVRRKEAELARFHKIQEEAIEHAAKLAEFHEIYIKIEESGVRAPTWRRQLAVCWSVLAHGTPLDTQAAQLGISVAAAHKDAQRGRDLLIKFGASSGLVAAIRR